MQDEHSTRLATDAPVPVAPLAYEAPRAKAWMAHVVRWFAVAGIVVATLHLTQTVAQLSTMAMRAPVGFSNWRNVMGVGLELLRGVAALALIVTAIDLLRLRGRWRLIAVAAACAFAAVGAVQWGYQMWYAISSIGQRGFGSVGVMVLWAMNWAAGTLSTEMMPLFFAFFFTRVGVREVLTRG